MKLICYVARHKWDTAKVMMLVPRAGDVKSSEREVVKRTCSRCGAVEYEMPKA